MKKKSKHPSNKHIQSAIAGLNQILDERGNNAIDVNRIDLCKAAGFSDQTFRYHFSSLSEIISYAEAEIEFVFSIHTWKPFKRLTQYAVLTSLLTTLEQHQEACRLLIRRPDYNYWRSLIDLIKPALTRDWNHPAAMEDVMLESFTLQFLILLNRWSSKDFSKDLIPECARILLYTLSTLEQQKIRYQTLAEETKLFRK